MSAIKVIVYEDGVQHNPINLVNGDEMVILNTGKPFWSIGRHIALKRRIRGLEQSNRFLREKLADQALTSLEGATTDQLLDELKLRSEFFT